MRVVLDTHALFWWVTESPKLSRLAFDIIADRDNEVFVSAAVAWEITTKARAGRWPEAARLAADIGDVIDANGFSPLPITVSHAQRAGSLPGDHRDPFDRMLASQSQIEGAPLISIDPAFASLGVTPLW